MKDKTFHPQVKPSMFAVFLSYFPHTCCTWILS